MELIPKHKHKMDLITQEKIILRDANHTIVGHDLFTYKKCKCGFKQPIKVQHNGVREIIHEA